jgi:hypothetical protein
MGDYNLSGLNPREFEHLVQALALNRSTEDWYTHAATCVCSSEAIFSTAAVTAGS